MHSGGGRVLAGKQKSALSVYVGIVSLVLEGRALGDDDDDENFLRSQSPHLHLHHPHATSTHHELETSTSSNVSGNARHGVINRISEKLMRLRQFPGTSKELDVVETSIAIPVSSDDYERQPRLHHVASAREFQRNLRLTSIPTSSTSNSSSAASVLHDIDVDWNDISILLNGLDPIVNVPAFPLKIPSPSAHHHLAYPRAISHAMCINQKLLASKNQSRMPEKTTCGSPSSNAASLKPKQGPHCEKFLKKLGLFKVDSPESLETDHMCNHVNSYCRRWQFHLKKLLQVLSKAEDACIEVYLGPENNAILLEQWIITLTDKPSSSTMTIQALCSAIRSQLCFSQVSSWIDLLKKTFVESDLRFSEQMPSLLTPEIMQNPRLKKNLQTMQASLDILFRVKSYDGTSCFNEKPNVHNFPDTIISDSLAICVCLKSLPRLEKIPTLNTEKAHLNGFSFACDSHMAVAGGGSGRLLNDRMAFSSCHEKGKHRCKEEIDDEEEICRKDTSTNAMPTSSSSISSESSTTTGLAHRERQLLKYKKRLMKRDMKQKKKQIESGGEQSSHAAANTSSKACNKENIDSAIDVTDNINSMEIPLYQQQFIAKKMEVKDEMQTAIKSSSENCKISSPSTLSIATQTEFNDASQKCDSCGSPLQCINCDKVRNLTSNNFNQMASPLSIVVPAATSTQSSSRSQISTVSGTMVGNKANLLLQAIQRTAIAHQQQRDDFLRDNLIFSSLKIQTTPPRDKSSSSNASSINAMSDDCDSLLSSNNNNNENSIEISKENSDCRLCKRQKTKHNYAPSISVNSSSPGSSYRRTMSECMVGLAGENDDYIDEYHEGGPRMDKVDGSTFLSPLPTHNCDDLQLTSSSMDDMLSFGELKAYRRAFSEDVINQLPDDYVDDDEVITIKCHHTSPDTEDDASQIHKLTPNVTLLNTNRDIPVSSNKLQQRIPKINLTPIFDIIQPSQTQRPNDSGIGNDSSLDFSPTSDNVFVFNSPVKSYPPSTVQLSPGTAIMKRRTRHISDRSSISEYCSDEDDDVLTKCANVPTSKISSLYKKFVSKTQTAFNKFSKLPLLASIEENLLHNRFQPKAIVDGFKLLLGASGSFCPTQLTIPAQTYFYEFHGIRHMSTPYVCEFRLARKYSIPRSGTVQATLLNPQGTVVRMFFVPYDFRDMPAMSQTFIRQRVLAIDERITQKNVEQMSTSEQMRHLRYVINLRFQTGRSGRLCLHTDIKLVISRRTEFDTAAAHAKNSLESPNDLKTVIICPDNPKFSSRIEKN